tara:strand:- start:798 stop:977 length:180 start_codon:yes stop_codon:yes gene_type:complete
MNINEIKIIIINNLNNLNINIIDLNDLCIDKIIYFINNDLKSIINFGNTCKKELFNFII